MLFKEIIAYAEPGAGPTAHSDLKQRVNDVLFKLIVDSAVNDNRDPAFHLDKKIKGTIVNHINKLSLLMTIGDPVTCKYRDSDRAIIWGAASGFVVGAVNVRMQWHGSKGDFLVKAGWKNSFRAVTRGAIGLAAAMDSPLTLNYRGVNFKVNPKSKTDALRAQFMTAAQEQKPLEKARAALIQWMASRLVSVGLAAN